MSSNGLFEMAALAAILFFNSRKAEARSGSGGGEITASEIVFDSNVLLPDDYAVPDLNGSEVIDYTPEDGMNKTLSDDGLEFLKSREGFAPTRYSDHKGYSIGYGHLIKAGESFDEPMSIEFATQLLAMDVEWAENAINDNVRVPLKQNQFDALVSFVYNVGSGAFANSTLLRKLNSSDSSVWAEFARWNIASGAINPGLVTRRKLETDLFLT